LRLGSKEAKHGKGKEMAKIFHAHFTKNCISVDYLKNKEESRLSKWRKCKTKCFCTDQQKGKKRGFPPSSCCIEERLADKAAVGGMG